MLGFNRKISEEEKDENGQNGKEEGHEQQKQIPEHQLQEEVDNRDGIKQEHNPVDESSEEQANENEERHDDQQSLNSRKSDDISQNRQQEG